MEAQCWAVQAMQAVRCACMSSITLELHLSAFFLFFFNFFNQTFPFSASLPGLGIPPPWPS